MKKKAEKNKNELHKLEEQTSKVRKDTPRRKTAGAEHDKNGLLKTQSKSGSCSLASVGSVDDGKFKFTTLGQGKRAQPWRANLKQKWSGTSENNPENSPRENEKH